jgi:hypothetical protein
MVDFLVNFIGSWTVKVFDVCFSTLIIIPILSTPCIGGGAKLPPAIFRRIHRRQTSKLFFQISDDRFRAGAHLEPFKNVFDVTMHRPDTDAHCLRDFLVHTTLA